MKPKIRNNKREIFDTVQKRKLKNLYEAMSEGSEGGSGISAMIKRKDLTGNFEIKAITGIMVDTSNTPNMQFIIPWYNIYLFGSNNAIVKFKISSSDSEYIADNISCIMLVQPSEQPTDEIINLNDYLKICSKEEIIEYFQGDSVPQPFVIYNNKLYLLLGANGLDILRISNEAYLTLEQMKLLFPMTPKYSVFENIVADKPFIPG